jgi:N-acetyl-1-D-myo-inositol-2-amino-2-deoxy-alpha-D-glucopyranoside deacetylase
LANVFPGEQRRLMAVHAHPDDESITTGGTLARCAAEGVATCLVTCTDGRYGPVNPDLGLSLSPDELSGVRAAELRAAAAVLDVGEVRQLGYHDSGMTGAAENNGERSFWSQPVDETVGRFVEIIRSFRPHVVITYDPFGGTGHPDHIAAHRVTLLAVEAAAERRAWPEAGTTWAVSRLLYPVFPVSAMRDFITASLARGEPHPMGGKSAEEINYTRPDALVTHLVSIRDFYERKRAALMGHRTQVGRHYPQMYRSALARREHEHFRLALDRPGSCSWDDIFERAGA